MTLKTRATWILGLGIIWFMVGIIITVHEYLFLTNYDGIFETGPMDQFSFKNNLIAASLGLFVGGILFGILEIFWFRKHLGRKKFWISVLYKFVVYSIALFFLITAISYLFNSLLSGNDFFSAAAFVATKKFILSKSIWHPIMPFLLLAIFSSLLLQFSERFEPLEIWGIISGKYFNPQEEKRIFMFLDLNDSTQIAEKLGNQMFYEYLNDYFFDISNIIQKYKGSVVDYIGDLVIINWNYEDGTSKTNCIKCFEEFEAVIAKRSDYYLNKFGFIPSFKAAVHCGAVIIGEIGRIKKSIKYSGDVLNTTARVEKVCGDLGAKIAVTADLLSILKDHEFVFNKSSNITLKGKQSQVDIYTIR